MKKLAFATIALVAAVSVQSASAQSPASRDRDIQKLTDSRDMSTGLPMNAPARTQHATPTNENAERDRRIEMLTDSRDMSTGLPKK